MPELPRISGLDAVKTFQMLAFVVARQKDSHVVLRRGERGCVIPMHMELAIGTLKSAIKQAGITAHLFVETYKQR